MIHKSLLLVTALASLSLPGKALAYAPNSSSPHVIPSSVVKPTGLPMKFVGAVINVEFSLAKNGQPCDIRVLQVEDQVMKKQVLAAFRQWRFASGTSEAIPSTKRFILPIQIDLEA